MADAYLICRSVSFPNAPYAIRRRRVEAGEVSVGVNDVPPFGGVHVQTSLNWRIVLVTDAPEELAAELSHNATPEDPEEDPGRRRDYRILFTDAAFSSIAVRSMPNPTAAGFTFEQGQAILDVFPRILSSPNIRSTPYDILIPWVDFEPLLVTKDPEPSPGVEEANPIPNQALNEYETGDEWRARGASIGS